MANTVCAGAYGSTDSTRCAEIQVPTPLCTQGLCYSLATTFCSRAYIVSPVYANNLFKRKTSTYDDYTNYALLRERCSEKPELPSEIEPKNLELESRDPSQYTTGKLSL